MNQARSPYSTPQSSDFGQDDNDFYDPKVFSTSGRIGRLRYLAYGLAWFFSVWALFFLLSFILGLVGAATGLSGSVMGPPGGMPSVIVIVIVAFYFIAIFASVFILAARRLNDFNASGWLSLVMLIPFVNFILILVLIFVPGSKTVNDYGEVPSANTAPVYIGAFAIPVLFLVLGILAAISIPAYQDYAVRAQVVAGLASANEAKVRVELYVNDNQRFPDRNSDVDLDWQTDSIFLQSIDVSNAGVITIVFDDPSNSFIHDKTIVLRPELVDDIVYWDCTGGDLLARYRPSECRP